MVSSKRKSSEGELEEFMEETVKSDQNKYHADDPLIVKQPKRLKKHPKRTIRKSERAIVPEDEHPSISQTPIAAARRYQIEVLDKALQSNTIAYLETGCGKTLIAVLLVKKQAYLLRDGNEKVVAVFLAPTVYLVEQQTEVLKINTDLKVDSFYGEKKVDYWNSEMWQMEIEKNEVMVMTPQVFLDALRHSFINMDNVELLIVDECHHTQKHHAYAKIMQEYYHTQSEKRPKVFGMTASPVIKKGVSSVVDCAEQMQRLEALLDAKVYTLKDRVELESYVPTPVQRTKFYDTFGHSFEAMKQQLDFTRDKYQEHYNCIQPSGDDKCFRDDEELAKKLRKRIRELHGCLLYCLEELGLWCAYMAAKSLLKTDTRNPIFEVDGDAVQNSKENFLREASQILEMGLEGKQELFNEVEDVVRAVEKGLLTPKVLLLVQCLLEYRDVKDMCCIVFVERVVAAMVLAKMASHMGCLKFLKCGFLAGIAASLDIMGKKQQQSTIEQFRAGMVNVLVATDVAEEGLDVQSCSSVIRFDLPKSVRSFIQSRGRARRPGSDYIIFLQRNNGKQENRLLELIRSEESMRAEALNRPQYPTSVEKKRAEGMDFYRVDCTGATVNTDSSISLIYRFCSKLPGDKYYSPHPEFSFGNIEGEDGLYVCRLILPPNGPFRELLGPPKRSQLLAKQSVCLEACKKLHHMEQITDHLLPTIEIEKPEEEEVMNLGGKKVSGAGTRKRKELHSTADIAALHGNWINSTHDVLLHAYIVSFTFTPGEDDLYSDFVLLISSVIDDDIANTEIPLFLTRNRTAKAQISAVGNYLMSADQLKEAKSYHELVFNGVFGKLIMRNKKTDAGSSLNSKNLLASKNMLEKLWVSSHMYLLLPLISGRSKESCVISVDWKTIRDSAIAAQRFSALDTTEEIDECMQENQKEFLCRTESDHTPGRNVLDMACGPVPISDVRGMAVVTIHTGKVYSVMEILQDKNAHCAMEGVQDPKDSVYESYAHYFRERYGKTLKFPQQPLLQLKQTHRVHNLLTRHSKSSREKDSAEKAKEQAFVEIPPELCLLLGVSNAVIRSLYLVPSVMHRFNALLLAGQLRCKIAEAMPQCVSIRSSQVMEALTTLRCLEGFSFEALELLGDSFLKYAVSRYLFLFYDMKHEGQLSARRCRAICNATLHRLAAAQYLPEYIRDEPFEPRQWFSPGMLPRKAVMCKCNLNNLASLEDTSDNEEHKADTVFRIGKTCNKGHRWICSKTISDVVEALIGAYLVDGSTGSALGFMKWMGMEIEFDMSLIKIAMERSAVHPTVVHGVNIAGLETELGYVFQNKTLLVEAFTHASQQDPCGGCCYQRLEFLGDAVLDFLITQHLFSAHPGLTPGILSDLRSAAVNNECFARSAVKHNLQRYLRHGSGELLSQITNFVRKLQMTSDNGQDEQLFGWEGVRGPKVLGDLVESVAGAILVDSGFDLDKVWMIMKPLLSPIVTPSTLPLHPIRELHELSHFHGFSFTWKKTKKEGTVDIATAEVRLENELITETAQGAHKKTAQKDCALQVLLALKSRGICHPRRQIETQGSGDYIALDSNVVSMYSDAKQDVSQAGVKHNFDGEFPVSNCKKSRHACDDNATQSTDMVSVHECQDIGEMNRENCYSNIALQRDEKFREACMSSKVVMREDVKKDLEDHRGVKLPEDKTSSSCHSTANLEINKDSMLKHMEEEISEVSVKGMDDETSSGKSTPWDEISFSVEMLEKGGGRSGLHEYCTNKKWKQPVYELLKQEGEPHTRRFTYSVVVYGPHNGPIRSNGDPMPSKKRAMDDAAVKVLLALKKHS